MSVRNLLTILSVSASVIVLSGCCLGMHPPQVRVNRAHVEGRLVDREGGFVPDEFAPYLAKVKPVLEKHPLPAEAPYSVVEIERTPVRSVYVAQVRGTIADRVHVRHHETICLIRGGGKMRSGIFWGSELPRAEYDVYPGQRFAFGPGEIHGFTNTSTEPTVAILIFSPPAGAGDDVLADPKSIPVPKAERKIAKAAPTMSPSATK